MIVGAGLSGLTTGQVRGPDRMGAHFLTPLESNSQNMPLHTQSPACPTGQAVQGLPASVHAETAGAGTKQWPKRPRVALQHLKKKIRPTCQRRKPSTCLGQARSFLHNPRILLGAADHPSALLTLPDAHIRAFLRPHTCMHPTPLPDVWCQACLHCKHMCKRWFTQGHPTTHKNKNTPSQGRKDAPVVMHREPAA